MKKILMILVGIIAIVCIMGMIAPKDFKVEKEIVINKPKAEVFEYVKYLKNQDNFSVWAKKDPGMKKDFSGTDGTVGCIASWDGNDEVGKGAQELKGIIEGERLDFELRFEKPFEATNQAYMTTESIDDSQTKVKWGFSGSMAFPMNIMLLFMNMDKMVGKDFSDGLANLKTVLETS